MTRTITKNKTGLLAAIKKRTGVDLRVCLQCKKCSSGCPVANLVEAPPSEMVRRLHLGGGDEMLAGELVWTCASCETCTARCPMRLDLAAVWDTLRSLARERGTLPEKGTVHKFNKAFLGSVKKHGRSYEIGLMTAYKLNTGTFLQDVDKFPQMLKKRKIALLPSRGADRQMVKKIFKNVFEK